MSLPLYKVPVKQAIELELEKGRKPLPVGTIKDWKGGKYKKTDTGWVPVQGEGQEKRGRGRPKGSVGKKKLVIGNKEEKEMRTDKNGDSYYVDNKGVKVYSSKYKDDAPRKIGSSTTKPEENKSSNSEKINDFLDTISDPKTKGKYKQTLLEGRGFSSNGKVFNHPKEFVEDLVANGFTQKVEKNGETRFTNPETGSFKVVKGKALEEYFDFLVNGNSNNKKKDMKNTLWTNDNPLKITFFNQDKGEEETIEGVVYSRSGSDKGDRFGFETLSGRVIGGVSLDDIRSVDPASDEYYAEKEKQEKEKDEKAKDKIVEAEMVTDKAVIEKYKNNTLMWSMNTYTKIGYSGSGNYAELRFVPPDHVKGVINIYGKNLAIVHNYIYGQWQKSFKVIDPISGKNAVPNTDKITKLKDILDHVKKTYSNLGITKSKFLSVIDKERNDDSTKELMKEAFEYSKRKQDDGIA